MSPRLWSGASQTVTVRWATVNASTVKLTANGAPAPGFVADSATGTITARLDAIWDNEEMLAALDTAS